MSVYQSRVLCELVEDCFGIIVRKIAEILIHYGDLTLSQIVFKTKLNHKIVKESLQCLIQHNLVKFLKKTGTNDVIFSVLKDNVFYTLWYSRYCDLVENILGIDGKKLFQSVIQCGQISASKIIFYAVISNNLNGLKDAKEFDFDQIQKYIRLLNEIVKHRFIIRTDYVANVENNTNDIPQFQTYEFDIDQGFLFPKLSANSIYASIKSDRNINNVTFDDDDIFWKINYEQFNILILHEILASAIEIRMMDKEAGKVFKILLKLGFAKCPTSSSSNSISINDLYEKMCKVPKAERLSDPSKISEYVHAMSMDESGVVVKDNDLGGGQFSINLKAALKALIHATIDEVIHHRFGPMAARLFRIVRKEIYVDQDYLSKKGMMSTKLGKLLLYQLVEHNFINLKEVRKSYSISSSIAANKSLLHIFCIDFDTVLRNVRESSYFALLNTKLRFKGEKRKNSRLLIKESKIEKVLCKMNKTNCTKEQMDEVSNMITIPERKILQCVHENLNKLTSAQLHSYEHIFIIDMYSKYGKS